MPSLVEEGHPVGLYQPKVIVKGVSGMKRPGQKDQQVNGVAEDTNGFSSNDLEVRGWREHLDQDDYAVLALRNLIFDICNQNGGGHGGSAIGMGAIGVALYKHIMRYNPSDPEWFDRDRFVLSNGDTRASIEISESLANYYAQVIVLCSCTHLITLPDSMRGHWKN
jgi:hypothetical protein